MTIIAIDGVSASGKGTIAKKLSNVLDIPCMHTGNIYRAVAKRCIEKMDSYNDEDKIIKFTEGIKLKDIDNKNLQTEEIGIVASKIARIPKVRLALLDYQRRFAKEDPRGAILEGRDIGTVVCPDADYKFFITATIDIRANRRYLQILENDHGADLQDIIKQLEIRDYRDINRDVSPLIKTEDAFEVDTSNLSVTETINIMLAHMKMDHEFKS